MPRRVDANHAAIVKALRAVGCSVQSLHSVGKGCPDLLVGYGFGSHREGRNLLLEVKDGDKSPSARKLTADEQRWHDEWRGQVCVVTSVDEAIKAVLR